MSDRSVWVKAAKSGPNDNCVEMCAPADRLLVRDTKQAGLGPVLTIGPAAASAWLAAARQGEFDALA